MLETMLQDSPSFRPLFGNSLAGTQLESSLLSDEERQRLGDTAAPARDAKANTNLLREGEVTDQLYVMIKGWGCRYKTTRDGSRQIIGLIVPGDVANLDSLMTGRPGYGVRVFRSARITALACDRVRTLGEQHAGIGRLLMRLALVENAILGQWALGLGRHSARARLAHLLCELAMRLGDGEEEASSFDLPLTQEQLADVLGLTSVHVNRTMQQLRALGLIETSSRTVILPDLPAIRRLAEFDPAYLRVGSARTNRRRVGDGGVASATSLSIG